MSDPSLFGMDTGDAPEPRKLSADRKRTLRQMAALERGMHPLSLLGAPLPLHPEAPDPHDREAPGPRCGTCRFRAPVAGEHARSFPKCCYEISGTQPYVTHGAGSDCRAWWGACIRYQPEMTGAA